MATTTLILGGSVGGLATAKALRGRLGREHRIVVVDRDDQHRFEAPLLWVLTGDRKPERILAAVLNEIGHDSARRAADATGDAGDGWEYRRACRSQSFGRPLVGVVAGWTQGVVDSRSQSKRGDLSRRRREG